MQIAHVRRSIILLRIREFRSAPIGALLLLGNFLAQQFAHQLFQSVPVSIGAYQTRGSLGAIGRGGQNTQVIDRKRVVSGKSVSERVDIGGRRIIKKKKTTN